MSRSALSITLTNFSKPNNKINYIHKESNYPLPLIKQVPFSMESRLLSLSSSEKIFNEYAPIYQEALKKSTYDYELKYLKNNSTTTSKQQRQRKIIWFNPPYSMNVSSNVERYFLNVVNKHFPPHYKFSKIFNRNNMKISYSCMPNLKSSINIHSKTISVSVITFCTRKIRNRLQRIIKINLTTVSAKPSDDTQTTENLLKTKNLRRHRTFQ